MAWPWLQNIVEIIWEHFKLDRSLLESVDSEPLQRWLELADCFENVRETVTICLVGKYTGLNDAYASVIKALQHSAIKAKHKLDLQVSANTGGLVRRTDCNCGLVSSNPLPSLV